MAMRDVGIKVTPGSGVAAAAEFYRASAKQLEKKPTAMLSPDAQPAVAATAGAR
jgi:hypothetical protein